MNSPQNGRKGILMRIDENTKENMRDIFDTICNSAQDLGAAVCKGAKGVGRCASLTFEIEKHKNRLSSICRKIGCIVVENSLSDGKEKEEKDREPIYRLIDMAAAEKKEIERLMRLRDEHGCPFRRDGEKKDGCDGAE